MRITAEDFRQRLVPIVAAQGFGFACGFAGVWLVSKWVEPADYGAYGVFATLATVGASVVYAGLLKFLNRHWHLAPDRGALLRETLTAMGRKTPWLLAVCTAATILARPEQTWIYGAFLFATAIFVSLAQLAQSALQAAQEHWRDLGVSVGISLTRSFAPPLFYVGTGAGVVALFAGFLLQALVGTLLGAVQLARWQQPKHLGAGTATLTPVYEGPRFVALAAAGWILAGVNRWIVAAFFGAEPAGYYTLAANLGGILPFMAGMVFLQFMQPQWFAAECESMVHRENLLRDVDRVAFAYTVLALALAAIVHLAMPLLTGPVIDIRYRNAEEFVFVAGCSTTAVTTGLYFHAMLMAAKRERSCFTADLSGAGCLITGGILSAAAGLTWFKLWLAVSPLVPWLVNRTVARRAVYQQT
ncbi:MAG: hypothetical protein Q7S40_21390 [Opitutaceae bacterium]|nr:hypothetical protein [Opitutaceae bacterium]